MESRDDPRKRIFLHQASKTGDGSPIDTDPERWMKEIKRNASELLGKLDFSVSWPPLEGEQNLVDGEDRTSAPYLLAKSILLADACLRAMKENRAKDAVYSGIHASETYNIATLRGSGAERAMWAENKKTKSAGKPRGPRTSKESDDDLFVLALQAKTESQSRRGQSSLYRILAKLLEEKFGNRVTPDAARKRLVRAEQRRKKNEPEFEVFPDGEH